MGFRFNLQLILLLAIPAGKAHQKHITHLYSCHKTSPIYWTNESRSFWVKNQPASHMGSDTTNCHATFCPCPTYTVPQCSAEKKTSHTSRGAVQKVFLLYFFTVLMWGQSDRSFSVLLLRFPFLRMTSWARPAWVSAPLLLSVFLSHSPHWWEMTAVDGPDLWLCWGKAHPHRSKQREEDRSERETRRKLQWPFFANAGSWNATNTIQRSIFRSFIHYFALTTQHLSRWVRSK